MLSIISGSQTKGKFTVDPLAGIMWEYEPTEWLGPFGAFQAGSESGAGERHWTGNTAMGLEFKLFFYQTIFKHCSY